MKNTIDNYGKIPPQDTKLEEQIIGVALSDMKALNKVKHLITKNIFYSNHHQIIWEAIESLIYEEQPIDMMTVMMKLRNTNNLDAIGGPLMLSKLQGAVLPTSFHNISTHVRMVYQLYMQREVIRVSQEMQQMAFSGTDVSDILSFGESVFKDLVSNIDVGLDVSVDEIINYIEQDVKDVDEGKEKYTLKTSYTNLAQMMRLSTNELILWASRKKNGKSRIMHALLFDLLKRNDNVAVFLWSMEDTAKDCIMDFRSCITAIDSEKQKQIKGHKLSNEDKLKLNNANAIIRGFSNRLMIVTEKAFITEIKAKFDTFLAGLPKGTIGVLVVDNLSRTKDVTKRSSKDMYTAFFDAADAIECLKAEDRLVFIVHHIKGSEDSSLERAYRLTSNDLLYAERITGIITQLILINNTKKHRDLIDDERGKTAISYNGIIKKRQDILNNMIILEKTEDRGGDDSEDSSVLRLYPANLGTLQFTEWCPQDVRFTNQQESIVDRGLTEVEMTLFKSDMWDINPEGDPGKTLDLLNYIMKSKKNQDNLSFTFDFLRMQYKKYMKAKEVKDYGRFTRKEDIILNIEQWLNEGMYRHEYSIHEKYNKQRDFYLYGVKE